MPASPEAVYHQNTSRNVGTRKRQEEGGTMLGKTLHGGVGISGPVQRSADSDAALPAEPADPEEHLTRDLARVRAKFGADPVVAGRSLASAWKSEALVEEDEAEFVDTVADCLGAGLSLDDALTCWDTGDLVYQAGGLESDDGGVSDGELDEPTPIAQPVPRRPSTAHRVFVR
jgi:hypothetical protein